MSKETDTFENSVIEGNLTVVVNTNSDLGSGNIECEGSLYVDNINENTPSLGINIEGTLFNDNYFKMTEISSPSNPGTNEHVLYIDTSDGFLKSKNNSGIVKIYNQCTNKGDLLSHNGTINSVLSIGANGTILQANSSAPNGLEWAAPASLYNHADLIGIGTNTHDQIDTHIASNSEHGATGDLVGTENTQTLINKTISDASNIVGASELRTTGSSVVISSSAQPTVDQVLIATSPTTAIWKDLPGDPEPTGSIGIIIGTSYIRDEQPIGTNGDAYPNNDVFVTRTLNSITNTGTTAISLLNNQMTFPSGTYIIDCVITTDGSKECSSRFYNITDSTSEFLSTSEQKDASMSIKGTIELTSQKIFEIQSITSDEKGTETFGRASGFQTEIYTMLHILQLN